MGPTEYITHMTAEEIYRYILSIVTVAAAVFSLTAYALILFWRGTYRSRYQMWLWALFLLTGCMAVGFALTGFYPEYDRVIVLYCLRPAGTAIMAIPALLFLRLSVRRKLDDTS